MPRHHFSPRMRDLTARHSRRLTTGGEAETITSLVWLRLTAGMLRGRVHLSLQRHRRAEETQTWRRGLEPNRYH